MKLRMSRCKHIHIPNLLIGLLIRRLNQLVELRRPFLLALNIEHALLGLLALVVEDEPSRTLWQALDKSY